MSDSVAPTADTHIELELKLIADEPLPVREIVEQLRTLATVGEPTEIQQVDRYLDDAHGTLAQAGLSARLRDNGAGRQVQVKPVPLVPGALMARRELGRTLPEGADAGRAIRDLVASAWPLPLGNASTEQLVLRTARTRYPVDGGSFTAELCLDRVEASAPTSADRATFEELELEFLDGDAERFSAAAAALQDSLALSPSDVSKYVRSLRLLGLPGYESSLEAPTFSRDTPTDVAARRVLQRLLQTIQLHESGTRVGADIERLHKMRVATRRLRSALSIFKVVFPPDLRAYLAGEFRWLAAVLGDVRDLDVHQVNQRTWCDEQGPAHADGYERLAAVLRDHWIAARHTMLDALDSARYTTLLSRAAHAFSPPDTSRGDVILPNDHPARIPVGRFAVKAIRKRSKRFRKAARRALETAAPEDAHELRVAGKKLRYTIERFAPILDGALSAPTYRLKAFQDVLGTFQDHASASLVVARLKQDSLRERPMDRAYLRVLECSERTFAAQFSNVSKVVEDSIDALGGLRATKDMARIAKRTLRSV